MSSAARISARGVILDAAGCFVLLRRERSGQAPYLVVPGGGLRPGESIVSAVERECAEELGAVVVVGGVLHVASQRTPAPGAEQWFVLCRLESMDDSVKSGAEFADVHRGRYETVRVAPSDGRLDVLRPPELVQLLRVHHDVLVRAAAALR